jgi:hypothetical protein
MREGQCRRDAVDDARDGGQRQRAGLQPRLEIAALQVLHDEIGAFFGRDVEVEDLHDVRMAKLRHDLRLAAEPGEGVLVSLQLRQQHLHRELPGQAHVLGLVDITHRAAADAATDYVAVAENCVGVPRGNLVIAQGVHCSTAPRTRIDWTPAPPQPSNATKLTSMRVSGRVS